MKSQILFFSPQLTWFHICVISFIWNQYYTVCLNDIWLVEGVHLCFSNLFNKERSIYGSKTNLTLDCSVFIFSFAMITTLHCEKERKTQNIILVNNKWEWFISSYFLYEYRGLWKEQKLSTWLTLAIDKIK